MLEADKGRSAPLDGSGLRIAIVQARFNEGVTNGLRDACLAELAALGVKSENIAHHTVPGALEVPLALRWLAHRGEYDALVALGCVIRGETYHFELVANESSAGITRGNTLVINGTSYTVTIIEPDGTGMSRCRLEAV